MKKIDYLIEIIFCRILTNNIIKLLKYPKKSIIGIKMKVTPYTYFNWFYMAKKWLQNESCLFLLLYNTKKG